MPLFSLSQFFFVYGVFLLPLFSDGRRSLTRGRHSTRARWWMERGRAKRSDGEIGTPPRAKTHTPRTAPDLLDCGSETTEVTRARPHAAGAALLGSMRNRQLGSAAGISQRAARPARSARHIPSDSHWRRPPAAGSRAGARTATCAEKTLECGIVIVTLVEFRVVRRDSWP